MADITGATNTNTVDDRYAYFDYFFKLITAPPMFDKTNIPDPNADDAVAEGYGDYE